MPTLAEKWIEQGWEEGFRQGLQQGRLEGLLSSIASLLALRFGCEGLRLLPEIRKIQDADVLYTVEKVLRIAKSLDEVRCIYQ